MRFVVYGAGAVGGVIGARLHQAGHDVVLVARGAHLEAIREQGLRIDDVTGSQTLRIPAVAHPGELELGADDVVLLTMKSQDTLTALEALTAIGSDGVPVVCVQNGVANERAALRRFERVYAVCVMCPAGHVEPGVVSIATAPLNGLLDIGRYPDGADETAEAIAAAFRSAAFESVVRPDVMRWKYRKLLMNLGNAIEALCSDEVRSHDLYRLARAEGEACLEAAGIAYVSAAENRERRGAKLELQPLPAGGWPGSSTVQSLLRGAAAIETDYLNGEIVLLGRLHGVPTPANALLQRLAADLPAGRAVPGAYREAELLAQLT